MSRRTAGVLSPLFFALALFVWYSQSGLADELPSVSGDRPYTQVSGEEPVKAESAGSRKAAPAGVDAPWPGRKRKG